MNPEKIAFIGGGNMGRALIGGLLERGADPATIGVGEASEAGRAALERDFGIAASADNSAAVAGAGIVVVAVKPQDAALALTALQPLLRERVPLVISVAAGLRIGDLQAWCGPKSPVVRAMPNRPALIGAGATGLFAPAHVGEMQRAAAENVMRACGTVVWVETEDELDVVTALSGSGPAYFFLLAELMMQAAIDLGLKPDAARTLAVETLHGAGRLAHASDGSGAHAGNSNNESGTYAGNNELLARLRAEVTSKGGTTEAATHVLQTADLRGIVARAMAAATQRGRELAAQFGGKP